MGDELLERDAELRTIGGLLDEAGGGEGRALLGALRCLRRLR